MAQILMAQVELWGSNCDGSNWDVMAQILMAQIKLWWLKLSYDGSNFDGSNWAVMSQIVMAQILMAQIELWGSDFDGSNWAVRLKFWWLRLSCDGSSWGLIFFNFEANFFLIFS